MRGATRLAAAVVWALVCVTGCSPVKGLGDGGAGDDDDDSDAGAPDATPEPGPVEITVIGRDGEPAAGVRVLFHNPDGDVVSNQFTDGNGRAAFDVLPGSMITVATTDAPDPTADVRHLLRTIIGVRPGDQIEIGRPEPEFNNEAMGDLEVDMRTAFAGTTAYEIRVGCDSFFATVNTTNSFPMFTSECNGGIDPVDFIATARDAEFAPLAFSVHLGVPLSSGTFTPVQTWRTDWHRVNLNLGNAPDGMSVAQGDVGVFRRGLDYSLSDPAPVPLIGGNASVSVLIPPGFAERLTPTVVAFWGSFPDGVDGFAQILRSSDPNLDELDIDLSAELPPRILGVELSGMDGGDPLLTYDIAAPPTGATFGAASIQWSFADEGTGAFREWEWFTIFPPGAPSPLALPTIPPDTLTDPATGDDAWPPLPSAAIDAIILGFARLSFRADFAEARVDHPFSALDEGISTDIPLGESVSLTAGGLLNFD